MKRNNLLVVILALGIVVGLTYLILYSDAFGQLQLVPKVRVLSPVPYVEIGLLPKVAYRVNVPEKTILVMVKKEYMGEDFFSLERILIKAWGSQETVNLEILDNEEAIIVLVHQEEGRNEVCFQLGKLSRQSEVVTRLELIEEWKGLTCPSIIR